MADENAVLMYKGHPLMRKDNLIYYGSMADSHIVMLQVLETKKVNDLDVATRVSVQLQLTDPTARSRDRIVKRARKTACTPPLTLAVSGWNAHWPVNNFQIPRSLNPGCLPKTEAKV